MTQLFINFKRYAAAVLAFLTLIANKVVESKTIADQAKQLVTNLEGTLASFQTTVSNWKVDVEAFISGVPAQLSDTLATAKKYTDDALAGLNLNLFGGRTVAQWEAIITQKAAELVDSEAARVNALKNATRNKVIKLEDYTGDINFTDIGFAAPVLGNTTTDLYKIQAQLGATDVVRNIVGLPGATGPIAVNNGDEIFVSYDAYGVISYLFFNNNNATVISQILAAQNAQANELLSLESDLETLQNDFLSEAQKVEALIASFN